MRPLIPTQDPVQQFKSSWKVANYNMRRQLILWNECFPYPWIAPRRFNSMVDTAIVFLDVQMWRYDASWSGDWAGTLSNLFVDHGAKVDRLSDPFALASTNLVRMGGTLQEYSGTVISPGAFRTKIRR